MFFTWFLSVILFMANNAYGNANIPCKLVTTFDAICKKDGILYIVSAKPCTSTTSIAITIVNTANATQYSRTVINRDIKDPIQIFDHRGKGLIVVMYPDRGDDDDERQSQLKVMLFYGDIEKLKEAHLPAVSLMKIRFYMFTKQCVHKKHGDDHVVYKSTCDHIARIGEFSSMCIVLKKNDTEVMVEPGIYITSTDVCTVPYSTTIIVFTLAGGFLMQTFTEDKQDRYLQLPLTKKPNCGLMVYLHGHNGEYLHLKLIYGCGTHNVTLIQTHEHADLGQICPLSNCTLKSELYKSCYVDWIYGKNTTISVHVNITLNICGPTIGALLGFWVCQNHLNMAEKCFVFDDQFKLSAGGSMHPFHISVPPEDLSAECKKPMSQTDGNLYLDGGMISLHTRGENLVHVMALRHFPLLSDAIPLFHTEFRLRNDAKERYCPSSKRMALKIGLTIAGVGIVIVIIVIASLYWCRNIRYRARGVGLPYKIHLGDDSAVDNIETEMDDGFHY